MARATTRSQQPSQSQPQARQPRASQSQSQSQRSRHARQEEAEQEYGEDEDDAGGEDDSMDGGDAQDDIERKAHDLVRLALFTETRRMPLRRDEISKKVLGSSTRMFNVVLGRAQEILRQTFGMDLVELQSRAGLERETGDKDKDAELLKATGVKKRAAPLGTKTYVLRSLLDPVIIERSCVPDADILRLEQDEALNEDEYDVEETGAGARSTGSIIAWHRADDVCAVGVLYVVLALILVDGRVMRDSDLLAILKRLHLPPGSAIPLSARSTHQGMAVDAYLTQLMRQGYLDRQRTGDAKGGGKRGRGPGAAQGGAGDDGGAVFEWRWGGRAMAEVGEKAIARFMAEFMVERPGDDSEEEDGGGQQDEDGTCCVDVWGHQTPIGLRKMPRLTATASGHHRLCSDYFTMSDDSDFSEDEIPLSASKHSTRASGKLKDDADEGYRITGALKVPRAASYTTQALYGASPLCFSRVLYLYSSLDRVEQMLNEDINLCPDYQRGIIDSIFRNFYVPPVIFGPTAQSTASSSIPQYLTCAAHQLIHSYLDIQIYGRSTSAFVRELVSDFVTDGLATTLDWDLTRGGDFRVLTHAVYNMEKWPNLGTVPGVSTLQKLLTRDEEIPSTFWRAARQTLDILLRISRDPSLHAVAFELPDVKKVAPVEVISAITLVHAHKRTLTLAQLADGIAAMRRAVRAREADIRLNTRVVKLMVDFIRALTPAQLPADPDSSARAAAKAFPLERKRKRSEDDSEDGDDDDEDIGQPPASKRQATKQASTVSSPKTLAPRSDGPTLTASQAHDQAPLDSNPEPVVRQAISPPPDRLAVLRAAKALKGQPLPRSLFSFDSSAAADADSSQTSGTVPVLHPSHQPPPPSAGHDHPTALVSLEQSVMARMGPTPAIPRHSQGDTSGPRPSLDAALPLRYG
ncbi:predicted protein [Postia placenta Mad-698-R]|uniref:MAGE domain-containing protein n=1 Tax=Postia placenta MAD-698-R-SB12 TaxID=670580 RepID=A0A1X6N3Z2_9APHY|nr:hypothetical protein POSPLADRAFT_1142024 [Postia placenta MAD-698-R-SB12]EED83309.1 predicted protein [Postia placenta Mad-698-R]OSX63143.1 hypothetical protein POSPLADRAFT_1142024 [Postia placenta MAD-698-R-SB12]